MTSSIIISLFGYEYNFNLVFFGICIAYCLISLFFLRPISLFFARLSLSGKYKTLIAINVALTLVSLPAMYFFFLESMAAFVVALPFFLFQFKKAVAYVFDMLMADQIAAEKTAA